MDKGKQILELQKREARAKEVGIQFIDELFQHFNVLATNDEFDKKTGAPKFKKGEIKHLGVLFDKEPTFKDVCTCESFFFGNSDEFKKANIASFQCKHLIAAREIRFGVVPE
jgi:hypothetical protein